MPSRRLAAARRAWARVSKTIRRAQASEVITVNDDFTDATTDVPALIRARAPLAVMVQEGKQERYRDRVKGLRYGVRQSLRNEATRGVAVLWSHAQAAAIRRPQNRDNPHRPGHGYATLVGAAHGILPRGVVWQDVRVRRVGWRRITPGRRVRVRLASCHRPPKRAAKSWGAFDAALTRWLQASPFPVILGTDNNSTTRPDVPSRWEWHHIGIDGFLTTVEVTAVRPLTQGQSDHRAVSGEVIVELPLP